MQKTDWSEKTMGWLTAVILAPLCISVLYALGDGQERAEHFNQRMRSAEGPGGYLDTDYNRRLNMQATGVDDVQIPLDVRQDYAREKGLQVPER